MNVTRGVLARRWVPAILGLGLFAAAFAVNDRQSARLEGRLEKSLRATQAADHVAGVARSVRRILSRQAVLVDGRRGAFLDRLRRAADAPALRAAAAAADAHRGVGAWLGGKAASVLQSLAGRGPGSPASALLTDRLGKIVASWPGAAKAGGAGLGLDPYFRLLSRPGLEPGIVVHGYARYAGGRGAPGGFRLVAACGVPGPSGGFAGMLRVSASARGALLGRAKNLFGDLDSAYPGSSALLALGDGTVVVDPPTRAAGVDLADADAGRLLAAMASAPSGHRALGTDLLAVWTRVGSAAPGAAPRDVLSIVAFVPVAGGSPAPGASGLNPSGGRWEVLGAALLGLVLLAASAWPWADPRREGMNAPAQPPSAIAAGERTPGASPVPEDPGRLSELAETVRILTEERATARAAQAGAERELAEALKEIQNAASARDAAEAALESAKRAAESGLAEGRQAAAKMRDLTASLDAQRRSAEKAEGPRREQEAARLAAVNTLSAELKATLEVIKNYINTLLGGQGAIGDAQQEFLGVVINKSARLERLIGDLVEISELGSLSKQPRLEPLAVASLVQDVLVNARPQAENKNISLEFSETVPVAPAKADRERLESVVRGLLSQAIKVSPRNEKISLTLRERDAFVELRVTDMGLALNSDRAAKVFAQFHGVDSQAGPEFIGTGLRFPILRSAVESQGGTIAIESLPGGKGKSFVLAFPKASIGDPSAPPSSPLLPRLGQPLAPPPLSPSKPVLGPLPAPKPLSGPVPGAPLALGLPPLPLPPGPGAAGPVPAPSAPLPSAPAVHKPAPLDASLNAPWKRREAVSDDLNELMDLTPPAVPVSAAPPPAPAPAQAAPAPAPLSALDPGKGPQASGQEAPLAAEDFAEFSSVFAGGSGPTQPLARAPHPKAPGPGDLDALFGPTDAPQEEVLKPAPRVPPPGLESLDDLNKLLGQ